MQEITHRYRSALSPNLLDIGTVNHSVHKSKLNDCAHKSKLLNTSKWIGLLVVCTTLGACGGGSSTNVLAGNEGSNGTTTDGSTTNGASTSGATTDGTTSNGSTSSGDSTGNATGSTGDGNNASTQPIQLSALPNPPLSPAPSAQDEPVPIAGPVSTATEYFLVRDPGGLLPEDPFGVLTDADYEAGPLPAVAYVPADVDTSTNAAPYFENLNDQTLFAGEQLNLILKPVDPDGDVPGMFPEAIPEGAQYIDNLNGTRTLRWRPLQPDVGITEFTITAVDARAPMYRTERTIRIRVQMPSDPENIINLPPAIDEIRQHTVRVNDPVVVEIKGTDPNGTSPLLEVLNQPAGATLVPHETYPNVSVLRFKPQAAGTIQLDVLVRDELDFNSTASRTIDIEVRDRDDFNRPGSRLRDLALSRNFLIGYASLLDFYYRPDGALYGDIAAEEFNFVTTENSLKWDRINPLPGRFRWAAADNVVSFAKVNGLTIHGHTLVWHRQLPSWIRRSNVADREVHMREYIDRVLSRYRNNVKIWDVVNESLEEDGSYRNSVWYEAMGEQYVDIAFHQARASAPDATLLYNDYDVAWNGPKSTAMFTLLQNLKDRQTPIDGVGFQMHISANFNQYAEVEANFQKAVDMDLDVYVTELDVSLFDGATLAQQAEVYEKVLDICLRQPRCKALQSWGFTDMYSWRSDFSPLLLDERYTVKPAYTALQRRLSAN